MSDRALQQIDRRIADTLEEIRILRVEFGEMMAEQQEARKRSDALWAEGRENWAEGRENWIETRENWIEAREEWARQRAASERHAEAIWTEIRSMRETADLQTEELRKQSAELVQVSNTNAIQTDALRLVLERMEGASS